jgi:hypothetical protein
VPGGNFSGNVIDPNFPWKFTGDGFIVEFDSPDGSAARKPPPANKPIAAIAATSVKLYPRLVIASLSFFLFLRRANDRTLILSSPARIFLAYPANSNGFQELQ